jgi:hypothetical protein
MVATLDDVRMMERLDRSLGIDDGMVSYVSRRDVGGGGGSFVGYTHPDGSMEIADDLTPAEQRATKAHEYIVHVLMGMSDRNAREHGKAHARSAQYLHGIGDNEAFEASYGMAKRLAQGKGEDRVFGETASDYIERLVSEGRIGGEGPTAEDYLGRGRARRGGASAGEDKGFWDLLLERSEYMETNYPFVDTEEAGDFWKIPANWIASMAASYISNTVFPESTRGNRIMDFFGTSLDILADTTEETRARTAAKIFRKFMLWNAYSDGATKIEDVYTYRLVDGTEVPFYVRQRGETFNAQDYQAHLNFVTNRRISPYNKMDESAKGMLEKNFSEHAVKGLTRGDIDRYFEAVEGQLARWFARSDIHRIIAYGNMTAVGPNISMYSDVDSASGFWHGVGRFFGDNAPSSWNAALYNGGYSVISSLLDVFYAPALAAAESAGVTKQTMRDIMMQRQKNTGRIVQTLAKGRGVGRDELDVYEYKGATEHEISDAEKDARDHLHIN